MLSEADIAECDKARENWDRGGDEFYKWIWKLIKAFHYDSVNSDLHLMARDDIYDLWKSGKTVEELFQKAYEKNKK